MSTTSASSVPIRYTDAITSTNMMFTSYMRNMIATEFRATDASAIHSKTGYGDAVIADEAMQNDGDLLLSVGWGDGFAINRVNNDGTMTELYYDLQPKNGYQSYHCLALDKVRNIAYVGNYVHDGINTYDYSDLAVGGTTVIKLPLLTRTGNDLPSDQMGDAYYNGLAIAGDYLYIGTENVTSTAMARWHIPTQAGEWLTVTNKRYDALRGQVFYKPESDRVYITWGYNGEIWVALNASQADAKAYNIRIASIGLGDDCYWRGIVEDKANPNHIWVSGNRRMAKIDITDCITDPVATGTAPSLINGDTQYYYDYPYFLNGEHGFGAPHPVHQGDFITLFSDRGWGEMGGWYDKENNTTVMIPQRRDMHSSNDVFQTDYGTRPVFVTTANGSKYWIYSGYGHDGHAFHTFNETDGVVLRDYAELVLGTYTLSDNRNISHATLHNMVPIVPSECSVDFYISNNNGVTWEAYAGNENVHRFATTGNQVRVRLVFNGTPIKSPHIQSPNQFSITLIGEAGYLPNGKKAHARLRGKQ